MWEMGKNRIVIIVGICILIAIAGFLVFDLNKKPTSVTRLLQQGWMTQPYQDWNKK